MAVEMVEQWVVLKDEQMAESWVFHEVEHSVVNWEPNSAVRTVVRKADLMETHSVELLAHCSVVRKVALMAV